MVFFSSRISVQLSIFVFSNPSFFIDPVRLFSVSSISSSLHPSPNPLLVFFAHPLPMWPRLLWEQLQPHCQRILPEYEWESSISREKHGCKIGGQCTYKHTYRYWCVTLIDSVTNTGLGIVPILSRDSSRCSNTPRALIAGVFNVIVRSLSMIV